MEKFSTQFNEASMQYFRNRDGKPTEVTFEGEHFLGEGGFGKVFTVDARVGNHKKRFVVKRFFDTDEKPAEYYAKKAVKNYTVAQDAGLKVFPTYRLGEDNSILMTSGHSYDWICVGTNEKTSSIENFGKNKIKEVENFEDFVKSVFEHTRKAAEAGISIYEDGYFFFVNTQNNEIDFIVGDLDNVTKKESISFDTLYRYNIRQAAEALFAFFHSNVELTNQHYLEKVQHYYFELNESLKKRAA